MRIQHLSLEDFRNYERQTVTFSPGLNAIVGSNGQGKTNLLEAVYCLSGLGSPRSPDQALVRMDAEASRIHGDVAIGDRVVPIALHLQPGRGARAFANKTPLPSPRELSKFVVSVFFGPDELSLVKGSPDGRRRFVDDLVVKLRPARDGIRREWDRVLRQRNALLKSVPRRRESVLDTLRVWDEALCMSGARLAAARLEALALLKPFATKRYENLAGRGSIRITYSSSWLPEPTARDALEAQGQVTEPELHKALGAALESARGDELERGMTLVGPQRDDIAVTISSSDVVGGSLDARTYASQGEQRTCALALKLGEFDALTEALGQEPILLLDDVLSELDPDRRAWLADAVVPSAQALLTSAEPSALDETKPSRVLEVVGGQVRERG